MGTCGICGGEVDRADRLDAREQHQLEFGHDPDLDQPQPPVQLVAYGAGPAYLDHEGYAVVGIERGQPGFFIVDTCPTVEFAIAKAATMNQACGLTEDDVADIVASAAAARHHTTLTGTA